MKKYNRGISLLEVITVIGIIIVLIGLIMPATSIVRNNGKETETKAEMTQLDTALIAFFSDSGYFPKSNQMLASLKNTYFSFDPNRIDGASYSDKWGVPYLYLCPGIISTKGYDLFSLGLLRSQGARDTIGRIISGLSSTIFTSGGGSGSFAAGSGTILQLKGPTQDMVILAALGLLRSTDKGFNLAIMINISNTPIYWDPTLSGTGTLAYYWPYAIGQPRGIYLNLVLQDGPTEALASVIAHEATHLADHMSNGDMDYDSIEEEYDAFYNEAMVWRELTEGKTFTNLDDPEFVETHPEYVYNIETQEENLAVIMEGEEAVKENLRKRYPEWPEKDQYGDSYVVAKES